MEHPFNGYNGNNGFLWCGFDYDSTIRNYYGYRKKPRFYSRRHDALKLHYFLDEQKTLFVDSIVYLRSAAKKIYEYFRKETTACAIVSNNHFFANIVLLFEETSNPLWFRRKQRRLNLRLVRSLQTSCWKMENFGIIIHQTVCVQRHSMELEWLPIRNWFPVQGAAADIKLIRKRGIGKGCT